MEQIRYIKIKIEIETNKRTHLTEEKFDTIEEFIQYLSDGSEKYGGSVDDLVEILSEKAKLLSTMD